MSHYRKPAIGNLLESSDMEGNFYAAGSRAVAKFGVLEFRPNKYPVLRLKEDLTSRQSTRPFVKDGVVAEIRGYTPGYHVVLRDCVELSPVWGHGVRFRDYRVFGIVAVREAQLESVPKGYHSMALKLTGLPKWLDRRITPRESSRTHTNPNSSFVIKTSTSFEHIQVLKTVFEDVEIICRFEYSESGDHFSYLTMHFPPIIVVKPSSNKSLEWYRDFALCLNRFTCLLTGLPSQVSHARLTTERSVQGRKQTEVTHLCFPQVEVKYADQYSTARSKTTIHDFDYDMESILIKYLTYYKNHKEHIEAFEAILRMDVEMQPHSFLAVMQSLEALLRQVFGNKYFQIERDYTATIRPIREFIGLSSADWPVGLAERLIEGLRYNNKYQLKEYIRLIPSHLSWIGSLPYSPNFEHFLNGAPEARDAYTHRNKQKMDKYRADELDRLESFARYLMRCLLWKALEIPDSFIADERSRPNRFGNKRW